VNFCLTFGQLAFFVLVVVLLLVDHSVEFLDVVERLGYVEFEAPDVVAQLLAFGGLLVVSESESLDFLQVVAVALPQSAHLLVDLTLLRQKGLVSLMLHVQVGLSSLAVMRSFTDHLPVTVQLSVQICILLSSILV
jgi:hypothetical protein